MVPGPPNGKSQEGRGGWTGGGEAASAVAGSGKDQFALVGEREVKDDLQMTAQPASSPGRGEEFGKRRRASARRPEWDAGRELSYAACATKGPSLGQDSLTMEPETTIRSR
jgi:hypothetical protein